MLYSLFAASIALNIFLAYVAFRLLNERNEARDALAAINKITDKFKKKEKVKEKPKEPTPEVRKKFKWKYYD